MKIYTEINYKWLDGQLVKTSSKSFEYEGDLTLCGGGGGGGDKGGGGGGGGTLGSIVSSAADTATSIVEDPVGTVQDSITSVTGEDPVGSALDQAETVVDQNTDSLNDLESGINTSIGDGMDGVQESVEGFIEDNNDSLLDLESGINTNVDKLHDYGKAVNDVVSDELGRWEDTAMNFATDLGEAMGIGGDSGENVDVPDKIKSNAKGLKNKAKANLKVNKSKGRARKSLRIG